MEGEACFLFYDPHEEELRAEAAHITLFIDVADRTTRQKRCMAARRSARSRRYGHGKKSLVTWKLKLLGGGNNSANAAVTSPLLDRDFRPERGDTSASSVDNGPALCPNEAMFPMKHATHADFERVRKLPSESYDSIAREWAKSALFFSHLLTHPITRTDVAARLPPVISCSSHC